MKVAPLAMLNAVKPPSLFIVLRNMSMNEAFGDKFDVWACFLKTTISIGVRKSAIRELEAKQDKRMFTN